MTIGKTIALTRWNFVGKVMSLLFNMLSKLVIVFLPRSKRLLISWLQSPSAVTLEPKTVKSLTVSIVPPSICPEVMELDAGAVCHGSFTSVLFTMAIYQPDIQLNLCLFKMENCGPTLELLNHNVLFKNIPALTDIYPVQHKENTQN